jgi:hypothetical protein
MSGSSEMHSSPYFPREPIEFINRDYIPVRNVRGYSLPTWIYKGIWSACCMARDVEGVGAGE